jgi:predicted nucleotidyltransferase
MIGERTIRQAAEMLLAAAAPGSRVILFGSYARGQAGPRSDLDFLVVEPGIDSEFDEMVRLGKVLAHLGVAVDVLVASEETFQYWVDTPNTVYHRAAREGRVYEQVG